MSCQMAAKRSRRQLQEIADLLRHLYAEGGYGTWNEFATDAGVHPTQVSGFQNAEVEPSGYSLFKLLRAAAKRSGIPEERLLPSQDEDRLEQMMREARATQEELTTTVGRLSNAIDDVRAQSLENAGAIAALHGQLGEALRLLEALRNGPPLAGHGG